MRTKSREPRLVFLLNVAQRRLQRWMATQTDAKGQVITFAYDNLDRLTGKIYSTGQIAAQYRYDEPAAGKETPNK